MNDMEMGSSLKKNSLEKSNLEKSSLEMSSEKGKLLVTTLKDRRMALLIRGKRLAMAVPFPVRSQRIGSVYLGKVKKVQKNIDACFVEITDKELVFLPFDQCSQPFLTNRPYDGRILEGDELLVQIEREAIKTKQAAVTAKITLSGKYAVFSTGRTKTGISSKLSAEQRTYIRAILSEHGLTDEKQNWLPVSLREGAPSAAQYTEVPSYGAVIRTESALISPEILLERLAALEERFCKIFAKARHGIPPVCLSDPVPLWEEAVARIPAYEYAEAVTDLPDLYGEMQGYFAESGIPLRLYCDDYPLRSLYGLNTKLDEALSRRVWLKSGGYLVIDVTEALTVFDVNSGKYDAKRAAEDTFFHINREAAEEIAFQIRLRNLSGIILADFINMPDQPMKELLEYMRELLKKDPVTAEAVDITPLGLMEITRKKVNKTLEEQMREKAIEK